MTKKEKVEVTNINDEKVAEKEITPKKRKSPNRKITEQQEPPPALAVHRRGFLFGVLLWCEEESCAGKWLRPHCPCKIQYTRFYEKSHYISVKNQKSS